MRAAIGFALRNAAITIRMCATVALIVSHLTLLVKVLVVTPKNRCDRKPVTELCKALCFGGVWLEAQLLCLLKC